MGRPSSSVCDPPFSMVAKLLDRKEVRANNSAKHAIWDNGKTLVKEGAWLEEAGIEKMTSYSGRGRPIKKAINLLTVFTNT